MTEEDLQTVKRMIDDAIRQHNRNASIISSILGITLLAFYSHGLFSVVQSIKIVQN